MVEVAREVVALPEVGELLVDEVAEEAVWTEMLGVAAGVSTLFPLSQLFHSVDIDLWSLLQKKAFLNAAKSYRDLHPDMMFVVQTLCSYFLFTEILLVGNEKNSLSFYGRQIRVAKLKCCWQQRNCGSFFKSITPRH